MLDAPIVLGGLDGTGKTQLRLALEAHPDVAMARGLDLWTELREDHRRARSAHDRHRLGTAWAREHSRRITLDERFAQVMVQGSFAEVATEVGRQLCAAAGATRWGVQEALVELHLPALLADLPEARVVQLVRDPRDRYVARRRGGVLGRRGLSGDLAAWLTSVEVGLAQAAARPDRYILVRYEDLASDPEPVLRRVCDVAAIPYHPAMLHDGALAPARRSTLQEGIDAYRTELRGDELGYVERSVGTALGALGYERMSSASPSTRRRLGDSLRWQAERLAWRFRASHPHTGSSEGHPR
jgi:hypothetical protein